MAEALFDEVLDYPNMLSAWRHVLENRGCPGTDRQTLSEFGDHLQASLWSLISDVTTGAYCPRPLLSITIQKPNKKPRTLAIPSVRDRVLQTAVSRQLQPILEQEFEACSFGYRPGRSVDMAVQQVIRYRNQGYCWVVDADITQYFNNIDHARLFLELSRYVSDVGVLRLIRVWVKAPIQNEDTIWSPLRGVAQGSPISPLLANLYLDWFDEQLLAQGQRLIRFADDFLVLCKSREAAEGCLEMTDDLMRVLQLELNADKTRLTHFDDGFRFLGVLFLRSLVMKSDPGIKESEKITSALPKLLETEKSTHDETENAAVSAENATGVNRRVSFPAEAFLRTLYISEQGTHLSKEGGTLCVYKEKRCIRRIPFLKLNQIILLGNIQMTTPLMTHCLENSISVALLSRNGCFHGMLDVMDGRHTILQRHQFTCTDSPEQCLLLARVIVHGKLRNSRVILGRYARKRHLPDFDKAVLKISQLLTRVHRAKSLDVVRGLEGKAATHYFQSWRCMLEEPWGFTGRKRRPPPDPVNALLSFGYTLLFQNVFSLLRIRGLNTHVGFLHTERSGHPALASDLMEEFRAPVVDATVLSLLFNNRIKPGEFEVNKLEGSCTLSEIARKTFIRAFEQKMNSQLIHPETDRKMDYRRCIDQQVQRLVECIRDPKITYRAFVIR